jgi:hypothetical protein
MNAEPLTILTYKTDYIRDELSRYIGHDYAHTTWEGETLIGTVEYNDHQIHTSGGSWGFIVRFADGTWARCDVRCDA